VTTVEALPTCRRSNSRSDQADLEAADVPDLDPATRLRSSSVPSQAYHCDERQFELARPKLQLTEPDLRPSITPWAQAALTAATSLDNESLASPKSIVVLGS
jgi:hypothetical protein